MNVLFIASVAVVTADPPQSRKLFIDALGLPLEGEGEGYYSSGSIPRRSPGRAVSFGARALSCCTQRAQSRGDRR